MTPFAKVYIMIIPIHPYYFYTIFNLFACIQIQNEDLSIFIIELIL
jgi:hypothetical protein